MANMLLIKRRITTAQNVSKTTKALQMISTSKLKRAQDAAVASREYVLRLTDLVKNLTSKVEKENRHAYMNPTAIKEKDLIIVIAPDKGLCGGLVSNLIRKIYAVDKESPYYVVIGKKAESGIAKLGEVVASFPFGTTLPKFDMVYPIAKIIDDYYLSGKISRVRIVFSHFNNVFTQTPTVHNILPVNIVTDEKTTDKFSLFEPKVENMLPDLLKHYLEMVIYQNLLENFASEQGARMVSMKSATDNAGDIISDLKLEYNKLRQEKITNEILDIGSAAFTQHE